MAAVSRSLQAEWILVYAAYSIKFIPFNIFFVVVVVEKYNIIVLEEKKHNYCIHSIWTNYHKFNFAFEIKKKK